MKRFLFASAKKRYFTTSILNNPLTSVQMRAEGALTRATAIGTDGRNDFEK